MALLCIEVNIESAWQHVKAFLNPYNRVGGYICHLSHYMFAAGCRPDNTDLFTKVIGFVATMYDLWL